MTVVHYIAIEEGIIAVLYEGAIPRKGELVIFPHLTTSAGLSSRWTVERVEWTITLDGGGNFTDAHVMMRAEDA